MLDSYLALGDAQFEIRYMAGEGRFAQETFAILSRCLPDIASYFSVADPLPRVKTVLVPDRSEFERLVRELLRVQIEAPSNPARIAQAQRTDMVVLSPSAYEQHSVFRYVPDDFKRLLIHELVHMVEEHLTPDIEASPRWWSEGLAVHFSEQWRYEDDFRRSAIDGIAGNNIPSFCQIEAQRQLAYDWGWTIVMFVEGAYGREMIVRMVKECADGDVFRVIGEDAQTLEERWRDWLLAEGARGRFKPWMMRTC